MKFCINVAFRSEKSALAFTLDAASLQKVCLFVGLHAYIHSTSCVSSYRCSYVILCIPIYGYLPLVCRYVPTVLYLCTGEHNARIPTKDPSQSPSVQRSSPFLTTELRHHRYVLTIGCLHKCTQEFNLQSIISKNGIKNVGP